MSRSGNPAVSFTSRWGSHPFNSDVVEQAFCHGVPYWPSCRHLSAGDSFIVSTGHRLYQLHVLSCWSLPVTAQWRFPGDLHHSQLVFQGSQSSTCDMALRNYCQGYCCTPHLLFQIWYTMFWRSSRNLPPILSKPVGFLSWEGCTLQSEVSSSHLKGSGTRSVGHLRAQIE